MKTETQNKNTTLNKYLMLYVAAIAVLMVVLCQTTNAQNWQWAKHYGGTFDGSGKSIVTDVNGFIFVTGCITNNPNNPYETDIFVAKYDSVGTIIWKKELGGTNADVSNGIALNEADGSIVITGQTYSTDFPVLNPGGTSYYQSTLADLNGDAFVTKLDGAGNVLWSTYYGGSGPDIAASVAIDVTGSIVITGSTGSSNFPVTNGAFQATNNTAIIDGYNLNETFIVKFNAAGSLLWSTYCGGSSFEWASAITTDNAGNVAITGATGSIDFPVTVGAFQSTKNGASSNVFVIKFDPSGIRLWGTYLGGASRDYSSAISTDSNGNILLAGSTSSVNFPVTAGASEPTLTNATTSGFLTKFDPTGILASSTYCNIGFVISSLKTDLNNNVYVSGLATNDSLLFVRKYNSTEISLWTLKSPQGKFYNSAVAADLYGNVYTTGGGVLSGITCPLGIDTLINDGAFIAKIASYLPFSSDSIWPGDANNDLIANNVDLLQLGLTYGNTGTVRPGATINWQAEASTDWATSTLGVNDKNADCDGDGVVGYSDTTAILQNYGLIHTLKLAQSAFNSSNADLYLQFPTDTVYTSNTISVPVFLGTQSLAATSVYGAAFSVNYDPTIVDSSKVSFILNSTGWLGAANTDVISIHKNLPTQAKIDIGITRIDHQNVSGYGPIGTCVFVLKDDIIAKLAQTRDLGLGISGSTVIAKDGSMIPVNELGDSAVVVQLDSVPQSVKINMSAKLNTVVYPNPANDNVNVVLQNADNIARTIKVTDMMGKLVFETVTNETSIKINTANFTKGLYTLSIVGNDGVAVKQLSVNR